MIEPSAGRPTTSGPGMPLLVGVGATGALLMALLIGVMLGSGDDRVRTIIVGASPPAGTTDASEGLIQMPQVADELQQAYYTNVRLGAWVVCADVPPLSCASATPVALNGDQPFAKPATLWPKVQVARVGDRSRIYLIGTLGRVWLGAVDEHPEKRPTYAEVLGVTLNGTVRFLDLGDLPPGDYIVLSRSEVAVNNGAALGPMQAIGLTIEAAS